MRSLASLLPPAAPMAGLRCRWGGFRPIVERIQHRVFRVDESLVDMVSEPFEIPQFMGSHQAEMQESAIAVEGDVQSIVGRQGADRIVLGQPGALQVKRFPRPGHIRDQGVAKRRHHGSHEFLPYVLENPGSHLVNISSIFGLVAPPQTGVYALTKFAVRGYTDALRADLEDRDIHVSCVHPGVIASAAGASDEVVRMFAEKGMTSDKAAEIILKGVARGKPRILVTAGAWVLDLLQRLTPAHYTRLVLPLMGTDENAVSR